MEYGELTSLLDRNLHRIKAIGMYHEKITELKRLLNGGGGQSGMILPSKQQNNKDSKG